MGNNDNNAATRSNAQNRGCQGLFAVVIEIRMRLIEDDKKGVAIERASKCNPLALARRKIGAGLAYFRLVAIRQRPS